jgi:hypothetical protein
MVARATALAALVLSTAAGPPSPAVATHAFGRWLHRHYSRPVGYWTCPKAQTVGDRADCSAEFRVRRRWHTVDASARVSHGRVVISHVREEAWVRRWSRWSRRWLEADTPGKASVNGAPYDWTWLAAGAHAKWTQGRRSFRVNSYDGYSTGFDRFVIFRCVVRADLVTCRNAFGDAMRYRPRA